MELDTLDNFLPPELHRKAYLYAQNAPARWGEYDDDPAKPSGSSVQVAASEPIYQKFEQVARGEFKVLEGFDLVRMYINVFFPSEVPRWHFDVVPIDGLDGYTVLYYPHLNWERNQGGCTEFWVEDHVYGSLPLPNRAICFEGSQWHRATVFPDTVRFTFAMKFEKVTDDTLDLRAYGSSRNTRYDGN